MTINFVPILRKQSNLVEMLPILKTGTNIFNSNTSNCFFAIHTDNKHRSQKNLTNEKQEQNIFYFYHRNAPKELHINYLFYFLNKISMLFVIIHMGIEKSTIIFIFCDYKTFF